MVRNELAGRLESAGPLRKLVIALQSALALRRETGATIPELLRSALAMRRNQGLSLAQTLLAANAPILARIAMTEGDPIHGYLPSGSVAGLIDDRPSCEVLVARIVAEAEETLKKLCR
jgi:nitronate monooxygenase